MTTPRRKRKTTVGSISVPELPWQREVPAGPSAPVCELCGCRHTADMTCEELAAYCAAPGHDQTLCDCSSPFDCI